MGILDVPKGLISRLPLVGGSSEPKDEHPEHEEPVDETPEPDPDEPDEVEDEPDKVEPDNPDSEEDPDSDEDRSDSDPDEAEQPSGGDSSSGSTEDISDITAPSIGPNTKIEKEDPEERLARHEQSDTDAMGLDKRREVIGGNYSASFGKQLFRYALVVVVVGAAAFGAKLLVDDLDKPPAKAADAAPWTGTDKKPAVPE
jgi:hypothetical protein